MAKCEDHPCCGHTRLDPCPGEEVVMTADEAQEHYYCDDCGYSHVGPCPDEEDDEEPDEDDNLTDAEADAMTLASAGWGTDEDYGFFGGDDG